MAREREKEREEWGLHLREGVGGENKKKAAEGESATSSQKSSM
jgi:hypothetical protein